MADSTDKIFMAGPWITDREIEAVTDAMRHWYDGCYDYVEKFEKEFAAFHGRKYGLMTPNCTTAIHLLLTALDVKAGDEVIVPDCTWMASIAPAVLLGATPIFCDIDPVNWCLDPSSVRENITPKTKAIIVVDLYGNMPHLDELLKISKEYGIPLVEDSAEALGSKYKGIRAGKFGVGSVFSFHRTKTLTTGEGGMLLLDDDDLFKFCRMWRDHGRGPETPMYQNDAVTYKFMPFNVQAAIGYAQFTRFDELVGRKRELLRKYRERLADIPDLYFNDEPEHVFNSVWATTVVFGESHGITKQQVIERAAEMDVPIRPFFYPLSSLKPFAKKWQTICSERNPIAYDISNRGVNLSCAMNLTDAQIDKIAHAVRAAIGY
mgnify:FL=1